MIWKLLIDYIYIYIYIYMHMHSQGIPLIKYMISNMEFFCFLERRATKEQHCLNQGVYPEGVLQNL